MNNTVQNCMDHPPNQYHDWSKDDTQQAQLYGVHIWFDGTNGCYWVGTYPFHQGIEFKILRRAKQYCNFYKYTILGAPAPSTSLLHKQWTQDLLK